MNVTANSSDSGTKTLKCSNVECAARELRKFMRFVSKDGMDIDGLAGETLAKFVNRGWIKTFGDIYRLGSHRDEIMMMEGFGDKSADKIRDSIEAARRRSAVKFLVALSIPLCGPDVAKRLLGAYKVRDLFAAAVRERLSFLRTPIQRKHRCDHSRHPEMYPEPCCS